MSIIHADAVDVLLADPAFSVRSAFTARASSLVSNVRAIIQRRGSQDLVIATSHAYAPAWQVMFKRSELPIRPVKGDIVAILEDRWSGLYTLHSTKEDSFAPIWDCEVGSPAVFPSPPGSAGGGTVPGGSGSVTLQPRIGIALTILDASHVQFPEIPDGAGVVIVVNNVPLRPVTTLPGLNESRWVAGNTVAEIGAGTLDPALTDAVWALLYFA